MGQHPASGPNKLPTSGVIGLLSRGPAVVAKPSPTLLGIGLPAQKTKTNRGMPSLAGQAPMGMSSRGNIGGGLTASLGQKSLLGQ